ncbi:MAG: peptide chain release factor N(5)-glutamine methyltransferase [Mariprofundaceae bacterium]|nr:peptide chain release factor N(5)-glutamine methyltransferase [Mariprofundaceae bacterium]
MSAQQDLRDAIRRLQAVGCENPRLDAELLLMHVWGMTRTQLIIKAHDELPNDIQHAFEKTISERCKRIPIAYITGEKEFWSRLFNVSPDVLIPRPETEHLIEALLKLYPDKQAPYHFADIGTGSGCIAITIALEYPNSTVIATDISEKSLNIAQHNAKKHHVENRIQFKQGDLYQALDASTTTFDAIISNPPYVSADEMYDLEQELHHEPAHALTDDADGLRLLRTLLHEAPQRLKENGYLLLETGLCGLPETPSSMTMLHSYHDLAGLLRGGIYQSKISD